MHVASSAFWCDESCDTVAVAVQLPAMVFPTALYVASERTRSNS